MADSNGKGFLRLQKINAFTLSKKIPPPPPPLTHTPEK